MIRGLLTEPRCNHDDVILGFLPVREVGRFGFMTTNLFALPQDYRGEEQIPNELSSTRNPISVKLKEPCGTLNFPFVEISSNHSKFILAARIAIPKIPGY
ncbi:hypothetical protein CEXT_254391 [Caerostris extrusa]|uniref:Uncharacterized protein n=1 Tax=Caerostris extrusa TaxID=172846 RepID=A0AAV4QPA5_CAEEX|nr:hypothetical protein CEXT_254391 [Caerostris extrusa]